MNAIDTSVLVHFYDERDPGRRAVAADLIKGMRDGVLLWQVACEFMAVSRRLAQKGFTPESAWTRLDDLIRVFPLVLPTGDVLSIAHLIMRDRQGMR